MKKFLLAAFAVLGLAAAAPMVAHAALPSFSESNGGVQGGSNG